MTSEDLEAGEPEVEVPRRHGNGSIAHQIVGEFIVALEAQPEYADVAARLTKVVFDAKASEASLRAALFGDLEL